MNEYENLNVFFDYLTKPQVRDYIIREIREVRKNCSDGGFLEGNLFSEATLEQRIEFDCFRTFATFGYLHLIEFFRSKVLGRFPFPPVTEEEIVELAKQHLSGVDTESEVDTGWQRFLTHMSIICCGSSEDYDLAKDELTVTNCQSKLQPAIISSCENLWESDFGFWLSFTPRENVFGNRTLTLWGRMSKNALERLNITMKRVVFSASRSLHLIHSKLQCPDSLGDVPFRTHESSVLADFGRGTESFFCSILDCYFTIPRKGDSLEQRLMNAVHLLVESDNITNKSVALSLSISAVEALVCCNESGISDEIARNSAALLQPDATRRHAVIKGIKELYAKRSKTLHGAKMNDDEDAYWRARAFATAVLLATLQRKHLGLTRQDFLAEVQAAAATGARVKGVSPRLANYLPST